MKWETIKKDITLQLDGLGIVFYSEGAVKNIPVGMDFLTEEFWKPEKVEEHNKKGDIVGFCTEGDADTFELRFRGGQPDDEIIRNHPAQLQLGIEVMGTAINVMDLYWLSELSEADFTCPKEQQIELEAGFYSMLFYADPPARYMEDKLSDEDYDDYIDKNRIIYVYLLKQESMPECKFSGVPSIYWAYREQ